MTTIRPPLPERVRRAHEARFDCTTWDAWHEPFRDPDLRRDVAKPVHGCRAHRIWITD